MASPMKQKASKFFKDFFENEKAGGIVLVLVTILSLLLANSPWDTDYIGFWAQPMGPHTLTEWINDGLMAIFFLLIGLELEREIYQGELSNIRNAALPIFAAVGGMILPASIFLLLNYGTPTQAGAGIPMATDIAFAVGVLSLLGKRVPISLKIFLTALAVIDDLGAIFVIAIFYTNSMAFGSLMIALGIWVVMLIMNRMKINMLLPYLILGVVMWYFMLHSGIHATITGVLVAFAIPFGGGDSQSISSKLQHFLHKPVSFIILPLFALANTCIAIDSSSASGVLSTDGAGIFFGLVLGKPLGIWLFSFIGVGLGLCRLPNDLKWKNIVGAGFLGGIGFTMSIFITILAFDDIHVINNSKIAILLASIVAGTIGFTMLKKNLKSPIKEQEIQ